VPAGSGQVGGVLLYRLHCPADLALSCAKPLDAVADSGHRIFAASAAGSGPVKSVRVLESMSPGANSFARGSTPSLSVAITTQGKLRNAASAGDARVTLQVAGHGTLDCGPGTFDAEVLDGCPSITAGDSRPTDAAATSGELTEGLNHRILGAPSPSTCTAVNHWSAFPGLPKGDPRIVELPVAPFGALGAGTTSVPISGFSAFYITGWGGSANPCQSGTDDPAADGEIVGHFIKYIDTLNDGGTGDVPCDFDAFGRCVAVLTG
jgi:hypothetical protein